MSWSRCIRDFRQRSRVQVYLEPGEAVAIGSRRAGHRGAGPGLERLDQAILDTSATCHMPDILEMPYRPDILGAGEARRTRPYLSPGRPDLPGG